MQAWRPYSRFPRVLGTRLTKSRVYRSGTRANSMYTQNFSLGKRLTFAKLRFCGSLVPAQATESWAGPGNEASLWLFVEIFLGEIWGCGILGAAKASNPREFSPRKSQFAKFSPPQISPVRYCFVFMILWLAGLAEKIDVRIA